MNAEIEQILTELQEYFDNKEDADWDYEKERFVPNKEMKYSIMLERLKELLDESKKTN